MFERKYDIEDIAVFERDILIKGEHRVFLKLGFSIVSGEIWINIDDCGYRKAMLQDMNSPVKLLDFLEKLFMKLDRARNYMFDLNRIKLDLEVIYIDESGNLAICFEPLKKEIILNEAIEELLLKIEINDIPCRDYLKMVLEKVRNNWNLSKLITAVGEMKREAYYCGYN